ncbi:MAG: hypothetical protein H6811_10075 [Phycisphaeraceae bacterium]|nr:hypothetical protein [Phycisphaeraceae bacterium]
MAQASSQFESLLGAGAPRDGAGDRLWPALSRPFRRVLPARGIDEIGERLRGVVSRRRARRIEWRRARAIVREADGLRSHSEHALDDRIAEMREAVALRRDDPRAMDAAYAVMREVVRRETGLDLFVEQVLGAIVMANGCCAEMATGEGKTVTAILPAALDGWLGRGVHVLTVNDYLARRDARFTSGSYRRLGLRVGLIQEQTGQEERRRAYECDITYSADKQVIFDFLRDRLHAPVSARLAPMLLDELAGPEGEGAAHWIRRVVQRGQYSAIVDEADSVLIDEAITPAIIGVDVPSEREGELSPHRVAAEAAESFAEREDYTVDRRARQVRLSAAGRARLIGLAERLPAFWRGPIRREELMIQALTAKALYRRGEDYIVREDEVVIVDRSTGRVLEGRQWQLGIHQAVEAKEGLALSNERHTAARVSYQRYFQRYRRLCGMSGTIWEVADELWRDYGLTVVRVPTHRPVIRRQERDRVLPTIEKKMDAVAARVCALHGQGRPVLVGTRSVTSSETLGELLSARGVACRVLNATREGEEAEIVAGAGRSGAVTVATNMAGRGTDILLDDRSRELGGLVVIATERNEERRVDRQLYGRAGRQGDPGLAETYVSPEDDLVVRHGLRSLGWLARRSPLRGVLMWVLLRQAQRTASAKARVLRSQAAKSEAWFDLAMHHQTR